MDRKELFKRLRDKGETLESIGKSHGNISRQRVYQILTNENRKTSGGQRKARQLRLGMDVSQENPRDRYYQEKELALTYYGNGKCACVICGFTDIRALSIDHIAGGGAKHKKTLGVSNIYRWLIEHNYPKGYRTLCMNCQWVTKNENNFVRKPLK